MNEYFKLFACCIPVEGKSISIICDLQRSSFHYIPNELFKILEAKKIDVKKLLNDYSKKEKETLKEYFNFLIEEEYGHMTDNPNSFPNIENVFKTPQIIDNAIIDFSSNSEHDFNKIFKALDSLGCKHLELRFFDIFPLDYILKEILPNFQDTRIRGVNLYFKYAKELTEEVLYNQMKRDYPVILNIIVHSSPQYKISDKESLEKKRIKYITKIISSEFHCGIIDFNYFSINTLTFFESQKFNSCLNKKLSIDSNGFVKNCPSLEAHFGNHRNSDLKTIVKTHSFQKLWRVNKDSIEVCKDCQFRYICTDCRAYTERTKFSDEGLDLSKPLKCGYNPYTNEWAEWSTNPLKEKAIEYYGMKEIIENDKK